MNDRQMSEYMEGLFAEGEDAGADATTLQADIPAWAIFLQLLCMRMADGQLVGEEWTRAELSNLMAYVTALVGFARGEL